MVKYHIPLRSKEFQKLFFYNYKNLGPDEPSLLSFIYFTKSSTRYLISRGHELLHPKIWESKEFSHETHMVHVLNVLDLTQEAIAICVRC